MTVTMSDVVAEQVLEFRRRRGWSADQLAATCYAVGAGHLTTSVIANIETGRRSSPSAPRRRSVTVDELLELAYALGVPPIALLVPAQRSEPISVTHSVSAEREDVLLWVTGQSPLRDAFETPETSAFFSATTQPLRFLEGVAEAKAALIATSRRSRSLEYLDDRARLPKALRAHHEAAERLLTLLDEAAAGGYSVPPVDMSIVEMVQQVGLDWPSWVSIKQ